MNREPVMTTNHPICQCVDLRQTFPGQYRFGWDEAYRAERSEFRAVEAPWLTIIPCKFGKIYPHGGRKLGAYCNAGGAKRKELEALPCVQVTQGGGADCPEVIVTFDVADIELIADVLKARHPRRYSAQRRAALGARLARVRPRARRQKFPTTGGLLRAGTVDQASGQALSRP